MKTSGSARGRRHSFTLIEMLVSIAILSLLIVLFSSMLIQTIQAWSASQQRIEKFQNGRAILEIMARELAPAAISPDLQFVQNPATSGQANLSSLLPTGTTQVPNSDSLFWARPSTPNSYGDIYETGYFLTKVVTAGIPTKYELVRFNIAPNYVATSKTTQQMHGGASPSANTSLYWIYDPPTAYSPIFADTTPWPEYSDAPWLTTLSSTQFQSAIAVVSEGVIACWMRCLDKNGNPIPWLYQSSLYSGASPAVTTLKFNSAAAFNGPTLDAPTTTSFTYSSPPVGIYSPPSWFGAPSAPGGTVAANRLPSAVELTIVTLDSRTLTRLGSTLLPAIPAATSATDVPNEMTNFINTLAAPPYNIKSPSVFSTTVRLINGTH